VLEKLSLTKQQIDELFEHFIDSLPAFFQGKDGKITVGN